MSRWVMRRQRKLVAASSFILFILILTLVILHEDIPIKESHYGSFSERCLTGTAQKMIDELCQNVTVGVAFGKLCDPLCEKRTIRIGDCIHHGSTYVLFGKMNREKIVLKRKRRSNIRYMVEALQYDLDRGSDLRKMQKEYSGLLLDEITSVFGKYAGHIFTKHSSRISADVFGMSFSDLSISQMQNSLELIGQPELVMMALHREFDFFPKLLGSCGPVYAMEQTRPLSDYFPQLLPSFTWQKRATVGLEFLRLSKSLDNTYTYPLHHCDIQEGNFGLTQDMKLKLIDVDLIYADDRMKDILVQPSCTSDDQCDFFDCVSKCNTTAGKCTDRRVTNNLQVICRDIFLTKYSSMGLLGRYQPSSTKEQLGKLLGECASSHFGALPMVHPAVTKMIDDLELLLKHSLDSNVSKVL